MEEQQTFEWIEQYLEGKLQEKDLIDFEHRLQSDQAFAKRVRLFAQVEDALLDRDALDVHKQLSALGNRYFDESEAQSPIEPAQKSVWNSVGKYPVFSIAAGLAFLILLGVGLWYILSDAALGYEQYASQELEIPYSFPRSPRGDNQQQNRVLDAIALYEGQQYDQALDSFLVLSQVDTMDHRVALGLGLTYLQQTPVQREVALSVFEKMMEDEKQLFRFTAQWYAGLILLQNGQKEKAIKRLRSLAQKDSREDGKNARKFLKQMGITP